MVASTKIKNKKLSIAIALTRGRYMLEYSLNTTPHTSRSIMALRNDQLLRDLPGAAAEGGGVVRIDATWVKTASGRRVVELKMSKPLDSLEQEAVKAEAESDWWAVTCRITIPEHPSKSVDISMSEDNTVAALKTRLLALYPELSQDDSLIDVDFDEQLERAMKPQSKKSETPTKSPTKSQGKPAPLVLQKPREKAQEELPQTTRVREKQETFGISNVIDAVRDMVAPMLESDEDEEVQDVDWESESGGVLKFAVYSDDSDDELDDEDESNQPLLKGQMFGGAHAKNIIHYLPAQMHESAEQKLILAQHALEMLFPKVASWPPAAHLVAAITAAAFVVEMMGFTLWATIAISVCYFRVRGEEVLRVRAEKRAYKLQAKLETRKKDLARMKFIAESVSQQGQVRALNSTFSKATDISWANTTFAAAWAGFLREWVNKKVQTSLCEKLEQQRPVVLDKIQIADFALSKRPPAASAIRVIRSESQADGNNVVELAISSSGVGFSFLVDAKLKLGIPFKIAVNFEAANLEARVSIVFIRHAPFAKCIRLSLADVPKTSLQIKPEGLSGIDVADLPGIDIWIRSAIEKATVTQVLEPNALYYDSEKHWNNRKRDT
jgi:hypothetical protein